MINITTITITTASRRSKQRFTMITFTWSTFEQCLTIGSIRVSHPITIRHCTKVIVMEDCIKAPTWFRTSLMISTMFYMTYINSITVQLYHIKSCIDSCFPTFFIVFRITNQFFWATSRYTKITTIE